MFVSVLFLNRLLKVNIYQCLLAYLSKTTLDQAYTVYILPQMSLAGIIKAWQAIIDRNLFHFGSSDSSSLKNKIGIWQNHKIVEEQNPDKKTSLT